MKTQYKIFRSESSDWFVAAKCATGGRNKKIEVLYEGHDLDCAYKSILEDFGLKVTIEERDMRDGYEPKESDFKE